MIKRGYRYARTSLVLLAFIHLVLPFTLVNHHPELHIKIASIVFGFAFVVTSFMNPIAGLGGG
ncbi:MAG: hypothetical protein CMI18_06100 [Opitutaceae bacterium]|nr:hypothetical protein [Opitutaceae bacterium]